MIGLLGDGSWAIGIMHILSEQNGHQLNWWVREMERISGLEPSSRLRISGDIVKTIEASDDVFVVIPSAFLQKSMAPVTSEMLRGKNIITAVKGLLPECNLTVSQYFEQHYGVARDRIAVVSGPSHAEEVAQSMLTYLTVASVNRQLAERIQNMLDCYFMRTSYSNDVVGLECAAMLKNVYAIGAGICHALGYGDNLLAVYIAAALREMEALIAAYAPAETERSMASYVYLSDMLATCYSTHSRNRTLGELIGRGYSAQQARLMQKMIAEGYYAVNIVNEIRQSLGIEMPIVQALYAVLYKGEGANRHFRLLVNNMVSRNLI